MTRLRALFLSLGIATIGAASYSIYLLRPEYSPADAVDAGILQLSAPARLSCRVRIEDSCRPLPDGGMRPAYVRLGVKARLIPADGPDAIAFDLPDAWRPCIRLAGTPAEVCNLVESGACTVPAICCANCQPQPEVDLCACRASTGGGCRYVDGGLMPFGVTVQAGEWRTDGGGCVRKFCGPEIAGEQGQSWPAGCPQ